MRILFLFLGIALAALSGAAQQAIFLAAGDSTITGTPVASFTPQYQAVIDRATALGYTKPSSAQQLHQDTLMQDLIAINALDTLDAIYIFANDGSSNFARINWAQPDTVATLVNSPAWSSNGFTGNGSNAYIDLIYTPSSSPKYSISSASVIAHVFAAATSATPRGWIGSRNSSASGPWQSIVFDSGGTINARINNATTVSNTYSSQIGTWHIYRDATNVYIYQNAILIQSGAVSGGSESDESFAALAINSGTSGVGLYSNVGVSVVMLGGKMENVSGVESAISKYLNSI